MSNQILDCGHSPSPTDGLGTGYGYDHDHKTHCYACCADRDRTAMIQDGAITLYLTRDPQINVDAWKITNWPGTLRFAVGKVSHSKRGGGFGSQRTDAWFMGPDADGRPGATWHAINRGDSQIARCRRVRS